MNAPNSSDTGNVHQPLTIRTSQPAPVTPILSQPGRTRPAPKWGEESVRAVQHAWQIVLGRLSWILVCTTIIALVTGLSLAAHRSDFATHVSLGDTLSDNDAHDGAIVEYREALRSKPDEVAVHAKLAQLLYTIHSTKDAIAEYRQLARLTPEDSLPHFRIGLLMYSARNYEGAIQEFKVVSRLNPNLAAPHYSAGLAFEKKGATKDALEEYGKACALESNESFRSAIRRVQIKLAREINTKTLTH